MENFITRITERLNTGCFKITPDLKVSEDGSTLICGCPGEECALIFTKQDSGWVFQQKLTAGDAARGAFGYSVSISSDGTTAIVGAYWGYSNGKPSAGAAYIFTRSGPSWTQQAKLVASDAATNDNFGNSVSISSDGGEIKILNIHGKEYTFTYVNNTWLKGDDMENFIAQVTERLNNDALQMEKELALKLEFYRKFSNLFSQLEELIDSNPEVLDNLDVNLWKQDLRQLQRKIKVERLVTNSVSTTTAPPTPINSLDITQT